VPTLTSFDVTAPASAGGTTAIQNLSTEIGIKAFETYVFELLNLADPATDVTITTDETACSSTHSPFFKLDGLCKEKIVSCAISSTKRGFISQENMDAPTCNEGCPPGTDLTIWGTCQAAGCSYSHFPFCFDMILDGTCSTFPFCFDMILDGGVL
jgi:hypothetical protein